MRPSYLLVLASLLFLGGLLRALRSKKTREPGVPEKEPEAQLPPPAGGERRFEARYRASMTLMRFMPSARLHRSLQTRGNRRAATRAIDSPSAYQQKVRYTLPFEREWLVMNGGPDEATSHSWRLIGQRYAYDFVIADARLRRWRPGTSGRQPEHYYCYGAPVLSPADGVVSGVRDGVRDASGVGSGWVDPFVEDFRGNFVVVAHAESEYSFMAHLIPGSVRVEPGERVSQGQQIGLCGNSGHSTEPHLHFHVQDHPDFFEAAGLPIAFEDALVDGQALRCMRFIETGERVRREAKPASESDEHTKPVPENW